MKHNMTIHSDYTTKHKISKEKIGGEKKALKNLPVKLWYTFELYKSYLTNMKIKMREALQWHQGEENFFQNISYQ